MRALSSYACVNAAPCQVDTDNPAGQPGTRAHRAQRQGSRADQTHVRSPDERRMADGISRMRRSGATQQCPSPRVKQACAFLPTNRTEPVHGPRVTARTPSHSAHGVDVCAGAACRQAARASASSTARPRSTRRDRWASCAERSLVRGCRWCQATHTSHRRLLSPVL